MILTKQDILKADDVKTVTVEVAGWGGEVMLATMSGFARDQFEASIMGKNGGTNTANIRAKLAAATIVGEDGKLLFTEKDIVALGKKSSACLDIVFEAAQKLNRITDGDVEDLAKN